MVHNGIDLDDYPFREDKDDFLVYIGRANPDKGPTLAIEVARRAGLPLAMVVKKNEPFERAYWDEIVAPLLNDEVEVYEAIPHEQKADLLGRARAMVFPIQWPEPFGLVMVEAMACGTPVVACPAGAAVELVEDGVTGYLRDSIDDLVEAVADIGRCSPAAAARGCEECSAPPTMVAGYERIFESVAVARSLPRAASGYFHYGGSGNTMAAMAAAPLLEIDDLHVAADGHEILRGLTLTVRRRRGPRPDGPQRLRASPPSPTPSSPTPPTRSPRAASGSGARTSPASPPTSGPPGASSSASSTPRRSPA